MEADCRLGAVPTEPVRGYTVSALSEFATAATREFDRLAGSLDRATERLTAARSRLEAASSTRGRLSAMIDETQCIVTQLKNDNERAVAAIVAAAAVEVETTRAVAVARLHLHATTGTASAPATRAVGTRSAEDELAPPSCWDAANELIAPVGAW